MRELSTSAPELWALRSLGGEVIVPSREEGGHAWLGGQARAAGDLGVEVQWCMALAHQILESTQFPSVTNAVRAVC